MIERDGSTFTATCDTCPDHIETAETDFFQAIEAIKKLGWRVFKQLGEWMHMCPACLEQERQERIKKRFQQR